MSNELDIKVGLNTQRPDIQIGIANHLKNIGVEVNRLGWDKAMAKMEAFSTEEWNSRTDYIPEAGKILVYTDRAVVDGKNVPGIKIADGLAYAVDLPFVGQEAEAALIEHISSSEAHVSSEDRQKWNDKLNYEIDEDKGILVLNRL